MTSLFVVYKAIDRAENKGSAYHHMFKINKGEVYLAMLQKLHDKIYFTQLLTK